MENEPADIFVGFSGTDPQDPILRLVGIAELLACFAEAGGVIANVGIFSDQVNKAFFFSGDDFN